MAYDKQTRAFLDKSNSGTPPAPGSQTLADFRAALEGFRPLAFDTEDVAESRDVTIDQGEEQPSAGRLFIPECASPPAVVIWAHGGSWVRVDVDMMDAYFRVIANRSGCAVLAVDYRLSPESRYPVAINEIYGAGLWARDNAGELGVDPERIAVGGESSGGNLAAAATLLARDRGEFQFAHQTLIVPLLDTRFDSASWHELGETHLLTRAQLDWALEQYAPGVARSAPLLSPLQAHDHSRLPPALIVTGEYDPLRDDGQRYAAALERAGVPVDLRDWDGLIHHAVMVPKLLDLGAAVITDTAAALGKALAA